MFSEHINMTTQKQLDESVDTMAAVFKKYPALQQLLKDMHGYIVAPSAESLYFINARIDQLLHADRQIDVKSATELLHFTRLYLHVYDSFSPEARRMLDEKLAADGAKQTLNRFSLKK